MAVLRKNGSEGIKDPVVSLPKLWARQKWLKQTVIREGVDLTMGQADSLDMNHRWGK